MIRDDVTHGMIPQNLINAIEEVFDAMYGAQVGEQIPYDALSEDRQDALDNLRRVLDRYCEGAEQGGG